MAPTASCRRGSSDGRVIMVAAKKSAPKPIGANDRNHINRNNGTSIAGNMWNSFESESSSEDDKQDEGNANKSRRSFSDSISSSRSQEIVCAARRVSTPKDQTNHTPNVNSAGKSKSTAAVLDTRAQRRPRSSTESSSRDMEDISRNSGSEERRFQGNFVEGDSVTVRCISGRRAWGTVSRVSSHGTYDVTLDNGDLQRRVQPDDMTIALRRGRRRRNPKRGALPHSSDLTRLKESGAGSEIDDHGPGSPSNAPPKLPSTRPLADVALSSLLEQSSHSGKQMERGRAHHSHCSPTGKAKYVRTSQEQQRQQPKVPDPLPAPSPVFEALTPASTKLEATGCTRDTAVPERTSSSLASTVQHAEGLLKTMFRRKEGKSLGGCPEDAAAVETSRERLQVKSALRRSLAGPERDDTRKGNDSDNANIPAVLKANDRLETSTDDGSGRGAAAAAATGDNDKTLRNGLSREGSSFCRRSAKQSEASGSPAWRSPSLVVTLGKTLRRAIMGKTQLETHRAHIDCAPGAGSDGDVSSTGSTYSTGGSEAGGLLRGNRPRATNRENIEYGLRETTVEGSAGENGSSCDGFDSGIFAGDIPLEPTACSDPRSLPEVMLSYIEARGRMKKELSASGPTFLPQSGNLVADLQESATTSWIRRRASVDITKQASSTTQLSEHHQPFTEALFKASVSETKHSTKQGILLEGNLQKFSPESVRGVRWHKRYFVLYGDLGELRYYRHHVEAAWGRIPLSERGSIPLRLVVKIEQPSGKKYRGSRFDLVVLHTGDGRHPGLQIRPGHERRVSTTKTFKLNASDARQRLMWVTVIETLMKKHGWG